MESGKETVDDGAGGERKVPRLRKAKHEAQIETSERLTIQPPAYSAYSAYAA